MRVGVGDDKISIREGDTRISPGQERQLQRGGRVKSVKQVTGD